MMERAAQAGVQAVCAVERAGYGQIWTGAILGFLAGSLLYCLLFFIWKRKRRKRIDSLTEYLEQAGVGGGGILPREGEDDFSRLQDEIYKTVTELYRTRELALAAKHNYAENLSNIAHQIKTPITAASLALQMVEKELLCGRGERDTDLQKMYGGEGEEGQRETFRKENEEGEGERRSLSGEEKRAAEVSIREYVGQIDRQLSRLVRLEESLLLLSRIDAGTLALEEKRVDVFTLLELSADHLRELFRDAGVTLTVEEAGEVVIEADLEWTMEAIMNLLKNCMEHTPRGGQVFCTYAQNPIYTEIRITDTGEGFAKEDLPRLFERFYRGRHGQKDGIGIGLSLAKEIVERQNGVIGAVNLPGGGACFEVRFYRRR